MAKVNWNLDYDEQESAHVLDVEFHVKKRIPHEKKMEFVEEFASAVAMLEEDGSANWNPYEDMFWTYLLIKYYTDIELYEDDNIGWIHDFAVEYDLDGVIDSVAHADIGVTRLFASRMTDVLVSGWEQSHSLQGTLARLTGAEEIARLAHAAPLNEELIDLLHANQEARAQDKIVALTEFAKKDR